MVCSLHLRAALTAHTVYSEQQWLPTYQLTVSGQAPIGYMSPKPLNVTGYYPIYFTSNDPSIANDACSTLPASTPNLSNRVVIVKRGTCTFDTKYKNIAAAGG